MSKLSLTVSSVLAGLAENNIRLGCRKAFGLGKNERITKEHRRLFYEYAVKSGKAWPWKLPGTSIRAKKKTAEPASLLKPDLAAKTETIHSLPGSKIFCPACAAMISYAENNGSVICVKCGRKLTYKISVKRTIEISLAD